MMRNTLMIAPLAMAASDGVLFRACPEAHGQRRAADCRDESRLVYDTAGGYISNVTLTTLGSPISCSFPAGSSDVKIAIQPVK